MTAHPFGLTDQQVKILGLVAEGLNNVQIGARLYITPNTAKSHMRRIGQRMGCGDRAGMVALAFRAGVLPVPDEVVLARAQEIERREQQRRLAKLRADVVRQPARRGAA